jgi:hypothetical protein
VAVKLQSWALVAEIFGGAGVILSLLLVAYELNQSTQEASLNTRALEIAAYQDLIDGITQLNVLLLSNPDLARTVNTALDDPEGLTDEQRLAAIGYLMTVFRHGDMAFFQYQQGVIGEARLRSALRIQTDRLRASKFAQAVWHRMKENFVVEYREYIDALTTESS